MERSSNLLFYAGFILIALSEGSLAPFFHGVSVVFAGLSWPRAIRLRIHRHCKYEFKLQRAKLWTNVAN